jgi:4-amino-4-deoxy-L-arabinose transferase-like glycosyltransferase
MEHLSALAYRIAGGEFLWIPRMFSSLFWTLGGLALFALMRGFLGIDEALIGLLYYLFDPFGLLAGRTFQPDPLMTSLIILSWLCFMRWRDENTYLWAAAAGLSAGAAIFVKSTAVFFLFFGFVVAILWKKNLKDSFMNPQVWLIGLLAVLPGLLYHIYGFFISGELQGQFSGRLFNPTLWNQADFYLSWLDTTGKVLGHVIILAAALLGLYLVNSRLLIFLLGTWLGFVVYGFAVSYYVTTHSYYLLPVIPLAAISLGAVGGWITRWLVRRSERMIWLVRIGMASILILGMLGGAYLYSQEDYRHEPNYYQTVASFVSPESRIIALSQDYGFRLAYFGWRYVNPWQGLDKLLDGTTELIARQSDSKGFTSAIEKYDFFIITRMGDFREDNLLSRQLVDHYPVFQEGGGYRIYDLRERLE